MFNIFRTAQKPIENSQKQQVVRPYGVQSQQKEQMKYYNCDLKLRENFAEELLNLELEIESPDLCMETITKLLELYREAVEYFEAIQSNKYLIFKNKIQILLTKKSVIQVMNLKIPSKIQQPTEIQPNQQKQKELQIRLNFIQGQDQTPQIETFITEQNQTVLSFFMNKQEKLNSMFTSDISGQSQNIQQRIQQRRNNSVRKEGGQTYVTHSNKETPQRRLPEDDEAEHKISPSHIPMIRSVGGNQYQRGRIQKDPPLSERPSKAFEQKNAQDQ